jgi:GT2 family glycosyltransferase/glycosyltransferase involved in cell wall biosynthesis
MMTLKNENALTILIIDATLPTYDQDSGSLRLFSLIKMLVKLGYQLTFFQHDRYIVHFKYLYALEALGVEVFKGNINTLLASRQFTLAWLCRVHVAHHYIPLLRLLNPQTKIFYDTVDIHYIREQRRAKIEDNPSMAERAIQTKRKELSNCQLADQVITVTTEDGEHLQQELPQLPFSVIPNIHECHMADTSFTEREGLVFIGHYRHQPNEDAVYYFAQNILPKIHTTLPDMNFYVLGSAMTTAVKELASSHVKIVGWVDQVEPEFAQRRVFVSPLRYGAGMKGKIGQALSLGLPVVTTSIGAEGMGLVDGETVLIADDPESFAEAVCRLYTDSALWQKLSHQGQAYIAQHYGETAIYEKLGQLLVTHQLLQETPAADFSEKFSEKALPTTELSLPKWVTSLILEPIVLPECASPRVSIVIPVFNQALYTYNCLLTLQACDQTISKEVIIINNASTDETADLLAQVEGAFTILNNEDNQGFVQACRQGAEVARGEFLVFLNNDTQVMPGWLSNRLTAMDSDHSIGITGSKLIYPDGRLQEAGGIIFNDASGYHYGRSQNPLLPQYNQSRFVDYCSGASLMIRKSLWTQLGGFDLRYAPAYYEDTDLCFAAREAGYHVLYCHNSEVIHHEGKTAGTDITSGYKAFQASNRKKFHEKWRAVLSTHSSPNSSVEIAAFRLQPSNAINRQESIDKSATNSFRIPEKKILATHLVGQGWAINFWSYLNLSKIDEELNFIKSQGFNTVIILVPWVGFQTHVDPITYHEEYFTLFEKLLKTVQNQALQVILRLGYTHDHGLENEPDGFQRACVVGNDSVMWTAWLDYLDRLWAIAKSYDNVLGGFLSWEDFALILLTQGTEEERLLYAERTGYQKYLAQHYSLETLSSRYRQKFTSYSEIPIPPIKANTTYLFSEFWDQLLIDKIVKESKVHFPRLTLEVRVDCDPQGRSHVCHTGTFDINPDIPITIIYYSPAWGAPNDGHPTSGSQALSRMLRFFNWVRAKTQNALFIDQFNFINNMPGFEHNTKIVPAQLPQFLSEAALIIQHNTIGYSLWTMRDLPVNIIRNGVFERNYPSWEIEQGEIIFDAAFKKKAVLLNSTGTLSQTITNNSSGLQIEAQSFQLDFKVKKGEDNTQEKSSFTVFMCDEKQAAIYEKTIFCESEVWTSIHLEQITCQVGYTLKIENQGRPVLLSDFYLYQIYQENGIIDSHGNQKSFYNDLISLNKKLLI